MGGNGLFNTVELAHNGALCDALLIGLDGPAARKEAVRPPPLSLPWSKGRGDVEKIQVADHSGAGSVSF